MKYSHFIFLLAFIVSLCSMVSTPAVPEINQPGELKFHMLSAGIDTAGPKKGKQLKAKDAKENLTESCDTCPKRVDSLNAIILSDQELYNVVQYIMSTGKYSANSAQTLVDLIINRRSRFLPKATK